MSLLLFALSPALAGTLTLSADDARLSASTWEARQISTADRWGCWAWDVLQGSGWFPMTWYTGVEPSGAWLYELETGPWRWWCAAELDRYNYLRLDFDDGAEALSGHLSVVPGGAEQAVEIDCWRAEDDSVDCDDAVIAWSEWGDVEVTIRWVE